MKKILFLIICVFFLCSCTRNSIDSVQTSNDTLKFVDDRGYFLTLHYSDDQIESAEWVIVTDDEEGAKKLTDYYKDSDEFDVRTDEKTVILDYKENYLDKSFGDITKNDMEKYLKKKGYEIVSE